MLAFHFNAANICLLKIFKVKRLYGISKLWETLHYKTESRQQTFDSKSTENRQKMSRSEEQSYLWNILPNLGKGS